MNRCSLQKLWDLIDLYTTVKFDCWKFAHLTNCYGVFKPIDMGKATEYSAFASTDIGVQNEIIIHTKRTYDSTIFVWCQTSFTLLINDLITIIYQKNIGLYLFLCTTTYVLIEFIDVEGRKNHFIDIELCPW